MSRPLTSARSTGSHPPAFNKLSAVNKKKVADFVNITAAKKPQAIECLHNDNWNLQVAVDSFFQNGGCSESGSKSLSSAIDGTYEKFKDAEANKITPGGFIILCEQLGITGVDPVTLVFAHLCGCNEMGFFSKEEFKTGMTALEAGDTEKLKSKVPDMRKMLNDVDDLKSIYQSVFRLALENEGKNLPLDVSVEYWKMLLPPHFVLLDDWIEFMEANCKNTISKDTWMMLFDFATSISPDLSDFDDDGAWPVVIDDFVEWKRKKNSAAS